jgi:hypothetical protein
MINPFHVLMLICQLEGRGRLKKKFELDSALDLFFHRLGPKRVICTAQPGFNELEGRHEFTMLRG